MAFSTNPQNPQKITLTLTTPVARLPPIPGLGQQSMATLATTNY